MGVCHEIFFPSCFLTRNLLDRGLHSVGQENKPSIVSRLGWLFNLLSRVLSHSKYFRSQGRFVKAQLFSQDAQQPGYQAIVGK